MKILYVYGMSQTKDIVDTLRLLKYEVLEYPVKQDNSVLNDEKVEEIVAYAKEKGATHLMSIHLIYNLALAAYKANVKYVSIIWDAPYLKLYTPFSKLDMCYFSVFDRLDYEKFKAAGIPNVIYQPLAVNKRAVEKWNVKSKLKGKYINDISFVGRLYGNNSYDRIAGEIPEEFQNYFMSIMEEAAFVWDGVNRVYGKTSPEVLRYIQHINPNFSFENQFDIEDVYFFEVLYLTRKIANIERICVLNLLAENFNMTFYTDKNEDVSKLEGVKIMPPVEPGEAISIIYAASKINLNLSIKGIEGGTPQRIMDILGAGGFCMTNYCEETAELFEEDKEIVMFKTPEELLEKAAYYLEHDKEREAIAKAGQKKVLECYTYEKKLQKLLEWVEKE